MLHKLQKEVVEFILQDKELNNDWIDSNPNFLKQYKVDYIESLIDTLETVYPAFLKLVGQKYFRFCALEYIKQNPPCSIGLIGYGYDFYKTIEKQEHCRDYFVELVKFESLVDKVHHSKNKAHPDGQLMWFKYKICKVYEFCTSEQQDQELHLEEGGFFYIIYKFNYHVKYTSIELKA